MESDLEDDDLSDAREMTTKVIVVSDSDMSEDSFSTEMEPNLNFDNQSDDFEDNENSEDINAIIEIKFDENGDYENKKSSRNNLNSGLKIKPLRKQVAGTKRKYTKSKNNDKFKKSTKKGIHHKDPVSPKRRRPNQPELDKLKAEREKYGINDPIHGRIYTCVYPNCDKFYKRMCKLRSHMDRHVKIKCEVCDAVLSGQMLFNNHMKLHDKNTKPFKCPNCPMRFIFKRYLTYHMKTSSCLKPAFKCTRCDVKYFSSVELKQHLADTHSVMNEEGCTECGSSITEECKKGCLMNGNLEMLKPYKCEKCDATFSFHNAYKGHITSAHRKRKTDEETRKPGERKLKNGAENHCQYCDKIFKQTQNLLKHERIHTGDKPYLCEYCSKRFVDITSLIAHQRSHTGERPYKCEICKKAYTENKGLRLHNCVGYRNFNTLSLPGQPLDQITIAIFK